MSTSAVRRPVASSSAAISAYGDGASAGAASSARAWASNAAGSSIAKAGLRSSRVCDVRRHASVSARSTRIAWNESGTTRSAAKARSTAASSPKRMHSDERASPSRAASRRATSLACSCSGSAANSRTASAQRGPAPLAASRRRASPLSYCGWVLRCPLPSLAADSARRFTSLTLVRSVHSFSSPPLAAATAS